jgi:molybdate transport system permease protein
VSYSFDATSRLAPQAVAGARADVFVSADDAWLSYLRDRSAIVPASERSIGSNQLVVIVPAGSPRPSGPDALAGLGRIALGGENVPVGRYARAALANAGVWEAVSPTAIPAGSARGVLEWVARGEVDAGVVYRTDAILEPRVDIAFRFDPELHPPIRYWAAALEASDDPEGAADFVAYLGSPASAAALREAGFAEDVGDALQGVGSSASAAAPSVASAVRLSLLVAFLATLVGLVPAVALGWLLARRDFYGKALVSTLVLAPLVVPPVVTGFLLLRLFGSQSPVGGALDALGLPIPFSLIGAALAALVVGFPLYVLSVRGAFEAVDAQFEEISWTLGVPPRRTFFRVALPLAIPGIAAGAVLAFARALGEFGATVVLAGNIEGSTRTIALAVYTLLESPAGLRSTWLLVGASVALSLLALLGYESLSRRQRRTLHDDAY